MTRISESFTFIVNSDICEIVTHSRLSKERLQLLLSFVFAAYAPITVISESVGNIDYAYTFAQLRTTIDVDKLLRMLAKREMGWCLWGQILSSPRPSRLSPD